MKITMKYEHQLMYEYNYKSQLIKKSITFASIYEYINTRK